jgi:hypothetical protein
MQSNYRRGPGYFNVVLPASENAKKSEIFDDSFLQDKCCSLQ